MAYELKAIFEAQDKISSKVRRITREIARMNSEMQRASSATANLNNAMNRNASNLNRVNNSYRTYNNTVNNTSRTINRNTNIVNNNTNAIHNNITQINNYSGASNRMRNSIGGQTSALGNLRNILVGVAGAYLGAQGAAKIFDATIGAAAQYEQSEVAVKAIFNDDKASKQYLDMVGKMAIDSPLLNSGEMLSSSKTLVAMTKNVEDLGKAWSIIERLMVLDPTQGTEGAAFALKEMWQGDALSMVERFGLSKKDLNVIKKLGISEQISEINKLLDGMGITQKTVNSMGETTLGYWAQLQERADKFGRQVGNLSNSKLGKVLGDIITKMDNADLDGMAAKLDEKLADITQKAINIGKFLWEWREPIMYVASAVSAATTALVGVGIIAALANPVSLIAAGIAAAAVGMKALYDNSATFRGMIDGIVTKAKELWSAFQSGGVGGVFENLFGEGTFDGFMTKFNEIKTWIMAKIAELQPTFDRLKEVFSQVWTTLSSMMSSAWSIISPILNGLWSVIQIIGDVAVIVFNNVIAPALSFLGTLFQTLWAIAQPILIVLSGLFEALGAIIKWLWDNVLSPLVKFIMSGLKNAFDNFSDALSIVGGWFEKITGWAQTAKDKLGQFADFISSIKLPKWVTNGVNAVVTTVGNAIGGGGEKAKSHYHGIDYVPKDRYAATLHKGEAVLPRQEAEAYRQGQGGFGGVTITGNNFTVREDADINRIADALVTKILEKRGESV